MPSAMVRPCCVPAGRMGLVWPHHGLLINDKCLAERAAVSLFSVFLHVPHGSAACGAGGRVVRLGTFFDVLILEH